MGSPRSLRRIALLSLLLAVSIPATVPARPAAARTIVEVDHSNRVITVTVQANLVGGHPDDAAYIVQSFNDFWGQSFSYRCYAVRFTLDLTTSESGSPARHQIAIVTIGPGDHFVETVGGIGDQSSWMWLDSFTNPWTVAHEFGHVLGLPDEYFKFFDRSGRRWTMPDPTKAPEYTWSDADGDGLFEQSDIWRDDGDGVVERSEWFPPKLKAGQWGSIMADNSLPNGIHDRHIKAIVERLLDPDEIECGWAGTLDWGFNASHATGTIVSSAQGTLAFAVDDATGALRGSAQLTLHHDQVENLECGEGHYWVDPATITFEVSGQRTSPDTLQINLTTEASLALPYHQVFCGMTLTATTDPWAHLVQPGWLPPLQREGERYIGERRNPTPGGEAWTVIEVAPAGAEAPTS